MHATDVTSHGAGHFAVLPDTAPAQAVARLLPGRQVIPHPSGRPWLVGTWPETDLIVGGAGRARIALIGCCPIDRDELGRHAGHLRDLADLDRLAGRLPGSFHLVAALDDRIRVQGSAAGLRLVFHTVVDGSVVAADRADVLAAATGAEPDETQLAVRLLWPVPHPMLERPMWRGIEAVPPGSALIIADGRTRLSRWWRAPRPTLTTADAAPAVRQALADAVDARARDRVVSCDLSGGLDSTSVCFLAAGSATKLIAGTWPGRDRGDTDARWAARAAEHLPHVEHIVWPAEESPLVYTDLLRIDDRLDEPTIGVMDRSRVLAHLPGLVQRGSTCHLTGIGGDHVAWCSEAYYHGLLRRRPLFALRRLRGFRALWQWRVPDIVRALTDNRPYGRWLADAAGELTRPMAANSAVALGWGAPPRMFDWMTDDAIRAAQRELRAAAETAEPLGPDRGTHADLDQIRMCTRIVRQWDQLAAGAGLPMASPFLDDRVIETCLSVRPEERITPWQYKPLLVAAMRGIVPDDCLARSDKAQASLDAATGLREHRGDLLTLWEDSRLAGLGLVDAAKLRALAHRPDTPALREAVLYSTIACEVWLRTLTTPVPTGS